MRPAQVTAIQARLRGQIDRKSVEDLKDEINEEIWSRFEETSDTNTFSALPDVEVLETRLSV